MLSNTCCVFLKKSVYYIQCPHRQKRHISRRHGKKEGFYTEASFKQSYKFPYHNNLGLTVYNCGIQSCTPGHSWGPAIRDHYLIHFILSGEGTFDNGTEKHILKKGTGFLVVPGQTAQYTASATDPWTYTWVGFNGADAQRMVGLTSLSEECPIFHYENTERLHGLLRAIYELSNQSPADELKRLAGLLNFLSELIVAFGTKTPEHKSGYLYVENSVRFIDYNYSRNINIDDIAANAGISRSHLYRLFMEHFSLPPNEYLIRYRISKAAQMLKKGGASVSEVAYSTGFSDQLYFSRVFKKYMGVPPSKYAQTIRLEEQTGTTDLYC